MALEKLKIIGIMIDDMTFVPQPPHHRARVRIRYDLNSSDQILTANCLCKSALSPDAAPSAICEDLVRNGLGQLEKMPEVWHGGASIHFGPDAAEKIPEVTHIRAPSP